MRLCCLSASVCRRQKHTLKAVAKHKLEQQLKDPAVRLKRLQAQLGGTVAPAAAPAVSTLQSPSAGTGISRAYSKQPSSSGQQQQQRSLGSTSGSNSSGNGRGGSSFEGSSAARLSKQVSRVQSDAGQLQPVRGEVQHAAGMPGLAKSSSRKQQQALSLPSLVLPCTGTGSAAGGDAAEAVGVSESAVAKPAGNALPRLQRL